MTVMYKMKEYRRWLGKRPELSAISEKAQKRIHAKEAAGNTFIWTIAPALAGFVAWTLEQAKKDGIQRLYFLARDGFLMKYMADLLDAAENSEVECRYLYVSRQSLQIPEQYLIGAKSLDRICRRGMHVTFLDVMARAGLEDKAAKEVADCLGWQEKVDEALSPGQLAELKKILKNSRMFEGLYKQAGKERLEALLTYLEQEGLTEDIPYAIVDSGWIGTMQESLHNLLTSRGHVGPKEGYYFGLYDIPKDMPKEVYHAFYFHPAGDAGRKAKFSNSLFECICSAPHGTAMGYQKKAEKIEAVLGICPQENELRLIKELKWLQIYAQELKTAGGLQTALLFTPDLLEGGLSSFMSRPSHEEARWYGGYRFCDDAAERRLQPIACMLSEAQIWGYHLFLHPFVRGLAGRKESGWIEGSVRLHGGLFLQWHRVGIFAYKWVLYRRMQKRYSAARRG